MFPRNNTTTPPPADKSKSFSIPKSAKRIKLVQVMGRTTTIRANSKNLSSNNQDEDKSGSSSISTSSSSSHLISHSITTTHPVLSNANNPLSTPVPTVAPFYANIPQVQNIPTKTAVTILTEAKSQFDNLFQTMNSALHQFPSNKEIQAFNAALLVFKSQMQEENVVHSKWQAGFRFSQDTAVRLQFNTTGSYPGVICINNRSYMFDKCLNELHPKKTFFRYKDPITQECLFVKFEMSTLFIKDWAKDVLFSKILYPDQQHYFHLLQYSRLNVDADIRCLVMPFHPGKDLLEILRENTLSNAEYLDLLLAVTKEIQRAHAAGILHGDIKLENIMASLDKQTGAFHIRLIDFELGYRITDKTAYCITADWPKNTKAYWPPERYNVKEGTVVPPDFSQDIFSLGCLYESFGKVRPTLTTSLYKMEQDMQACIPAKRPQMGAVISHLEKEIATMKSNMSPRPH